MVKKGLFLAVFLVASFCFANEEAYEFQGKHYLASFYDCDSEALNDNETLIQVMLDAIDNTGASVLDISYHLFEPQGMTMVVLLSESHASIHTYPEHNACFIDLFTCGLSCTSEQFENTLRDFLKPSRVNQQYFIRD